MYFRNKFIRGLGSLVFLSLISVSCRKGDEEYFRRSTSLLLCPDNLYGFIIDIKNTPNSDSPILIISPEWNSFILPKEYDGKAVDSKNDYILSRLSNLNKEVKVDKDIPSQYAAPYFYDASIEESCVVTADCCMFGEDSGVNLSDHFEVLDVCNRSHYLCEYPSFKLKSKWDKGISLSDFLSKGLAVPGFEYFEVAFKYLPEEKPSEVVISVSLSIEYESWDRFDWTYRNLNSGESYTLLPNKRTITGSVKIAF